MALAWTPEQKQIAKDHSRALVKFQAQLKHCGGGNHEISGPFSYDRALAMFLIGCLLNDDPRIPEILAILQRKT